jgi:phosphoribosylformimino-5-aminoimidazole carboxamide ribonucleotide (ProFAR) isomerase
MPAARRPSSGARRCTPRSCASHVVASIRRALAAGAGRVVVGTAAYADPDFLDEALAALHSAPPRGGRCPRRAGVGGRLDAGDAVRGEDVIRRLQQRGVTRFVYTTVDRDGMLEGPDLEEVRRVAEAVRGRFLYSGGIGSLDDLVGLRSLRLLNLAGGISGTARYEGR